MSIEKILNSSFDASRKAASYLANDPAGEASIAAGYGLLGVAPMVSIPLFAFGLWHIPHTLKMRRKLRKSIKKHGLNKNILNKYNESSWCSHRVAIAYTLGEGKYHEFKDTLNNYSFKHYFQKLGENISEEYSKISGRLRNIIF
jgi:hypothetical protein